MSVLYSYEPKCLTFNTPQIFAPLSTLDKHYASSTCRISQQHVNSQCHSQLPHQLVGVHSIKKMTFWFIGCGICSPCANSHLAPEIGSAVSQRSLIYFFWQYSRNEKYQFPARYAQLLGNGSSVAWHCKCIHLTPTAASNEAFWNGISQMLLCSSWFLFYWWWFDCVCFIECTTQFEICIGVKEMAK